VANLNEPDATRPNPGPSRASVALTVITLSLLALLVWFLNPRQPNFKPAPLKPSSSECRKPPRAFVPSNVTDLPGPGLNALPEAQRIRLILLMNTRACTCGCQLSIADCLMSNPRCETSGRLMRELVDEVKKDGGRVQGKK